MTINTLLVASHKEPVGAGQAVGPSEGHLKYPARHNKGPCY